MHGISFRRSAKAEEEPDTLQGNQRAVAPWATLRWGGTGKGVRLAGQKAPACQGFQLGIARGVAH